jgi:alkylhydroperoxidase/carboxymuconolactone decarboxylase family protein YurZ
VDEVEGLLRRLALNDDGLLDAVLVGEPGHDPTAALRRKLDLLVRLGALLALGAAMPSLRTTVHQARQAGASDSEIAEVLIAVGPAVGAARIVAAAPRLASALGYDVNSD